MKINNHEEPKPVKQILRNNNYLGNKNVKSYWYSHDGSMFLEYKGYTFDEAVIYKELLKKFIFWFDRKPTSEDEIFDYICFEIEEFLDEKIDLEEYLKA